MGRTLTSEHLAQGNRLAAYEIRQGVGCRSSTAAVWSRKGHRKPAPGYLKEERRQRTRRDPMSKSLDGVSRSRRKRLANPA